MRFEKHWSSASKWDLELVGPGFNSWLCVTLSNSPLPLLACFPICQKDMIITDYQET